MGLDCLPEPKAEDRCRHERYGQVPHKTARRRIAENAGHHLCKPHPVFPYDREHCAGLNDYVKDLGALIIEPEQVSRQDQVASARYREELGQSLNYPENQGTNEFVTAQVSAALSMSLLFAAERRSIR